MPQPGHDPDSAKRVAENYERYFVPSIRAPAAAELVRGADLGPGERILDAACGTGVVAKLAAEQLPLPDESFDAVLCGMGLQFFPDGEAGLREFHRVLVPGGRLAANVPGPAPPPFRIMAEVLGRHVDPGCASFVDAVISLELPPPKDFLWQYIRSTPLAAVAGRMGEESRASLENVFSERCGEFSPEGPLEGAVTMLTLHARK